MEKLIKIMRSNNLEAIANRVRMGKAAGNDLATLREFAWQAETHIECRLVQLESLAKALQVACLDADNTGIFDPKIDGFNFGFWLQEEAQTLQALTAMQSDLEYLSRGGEA
ncbi:hypothetical protein [Thiomicrorhabdus cannonii]|uniref:hypothetical protein n=1 Tax=Thiomicrorhabdus cannonii TaxID=2748011 RepID=UPI0015C19718|nr:hypothetical protein [Thiomicrorhabdus cannonii]